MKSSFFTTLIDTHNYGEYIEAAASSALAQDFPAEQREILAVNDGQASAFNFGFEHARGEAIVNTPTDAMRTFFGSGMDALVIRSFLGEK
jgi:glycosyltransferase involved in cell wall biosynthesis